MIMNLPNTITFIRLLLAPLIIVFGYFLNDQPYVLVAIIVCIALTDIVDGWVARYFKQTSKLGEFLDPLTDKVMSLCTVIMVMLWFSFAWFLAVIVLLRDFVLAAVFLRSFILKKSWEESTSKARLLGKLTTLFQQLTMVVAILRLPFLFAFVMMTGILGVGSLIDYWVISRASK